MKKIILILLLTTSIGLPQSSKFWKLAAMYDDGISYESETLAYQTRVEADGGEVIDIDAVNDFYLDAKVNNYLDTLKVALLYTGGLKKSNDSVFTWYDLTSNNNDFKSGSGIVTPISAPFYSSVNGIGNNTQPAMFRRLTQNQPNAMYAIVKRNNKSGYDYFWGSTSDQAFLQDGATDRFYLYAGSDFIPNLTYTNNTFELYRIIYAGASTSAQKNNGTVYTGNAGTNNINNIDFVLFKTVTETYFKCFIITPRLSTIKDLALKNILNTIYPTY